jgi:predicted nucleotidyltransferase
MSGDLPVLTGCIPGHLKRGMSEGSAPAADLLRAMKDVAAALRDADVPYLLAGSFAAWARGGPAHDTDLDIAIKPEDVERAVEALVAAGMTEKPTPEEWLRKVCDGDVIVDLIHDPAGLEVDDAVMARGDDIEVGGMTFRVMSIDDVMTTKLFAFKEHYLDYEAVLEMARMLREQIDWDELRRRCEGYAYAKPFFTLAEELGVAERPDGDLVSAEEVRAAQESRH